MAGLHDIVGAILRDIANARVSSDLYSRNISRYYEQDILLRRFPVPRMEVDKVEMDVKFAITEVDVDELRKEGIEGRLAIIFERHADAFAIDFIDAAVEILRQNQDGMPERSAWYQMIQMMWSSEFQNNVRKRLLRYFKITQRNLIEERDIFNRDDAEKEVAGILLRRWNHLIDDFNNSDIPATASVPSDEIPRMGDTVLKAMNIKSRFDSVKNDIDLAKKEGGYKVNVDVMSSSLQELPEQAISSIKVETKVRNYQWSLVEESKTGPAKYILNPE